MRADRRLKSPTRHLVCVALSVVAWLSLTPVSVAATVLDFEGLSDLDLVTNQFAPLTFSNTQALTAGISLNEFQFPPASGSVVVFDNFGPITIEFGTPVTGFGGFFTYQVPLLLEAFDAGDSLVVSTASLFSSNVALSGDPGSAPNEFLEVTSAGGIARVTITGDLLGGSFTLDDATYTPATKVPEAGTALSLGAALLLLMLAGRRRGLDNEIFRQ